jgi:general secretion pathway protein A
MYTSFFGLRDKPFAITPDPRYLFMSERHAEALAHLHYGINEAGGFIQLTGEIGTGKTTLVRSLFDKMPGHAEVAVILNPQLSPHELLLKICQEIGVGIPGERRDSTKEVIDLLNEHLLDAHAAGRRVIVIIDEAQTLNAATLEQVRLLTNLETATAKLLQIILIGQPELRDVLAQSNLQQLAQRITGRYHLAPLAVAETAAYVRHRLKVAGSTREIFTDGALRETHRVTGGVPRLINVVCDRALLGAYTEDKHSIDTGMVRRAAAEVFGRSIMPHWMGWVGIGATAAALVALVFGVLQLMSFRAPAAAPPPVSAVSPPQVVAPVAKAEALDVGVFLAGAGTATGIDHAFASLLNLWSAEFRAGSGQPCEQVRAQRLECVYQKGSWGQLRVQNRPAILSLIDSGGNTHQVVLAGLTDHTAHVWVGNAKHEVTQSSLSRYWPGDYLLVWRPHTASQRPMAIGMRGNEVLWLRKSLDEALNQHQPSDSDYYDEALAERVATFQRANRLTIDGIAGLQTQIVLDSVVDSASTPRLLTPEVNDAPAQNGSQTT